MGSVAKAPCTCGNVIPAQREYEPWRCDNDNCQGSIPPPPGESNPGDRECEICGRSLVGLRSDAKVCPRPRTCRTEKSRIARLERGESVDGYDNLESYLNRERRNSDDAA